MADDRHYVGGDNYLLDDLSGFKIRASKAKMIPGGQTGQLMVAPKRWEPQQPQDFVRGVRDDQTVAVARPRQKNQFVILGTYVTAPAAVGASVISVESTVGFSVGMTLLIMLDTGVNFLTILVGIGGGTFTLDTPLPATVGTYYGDPIENSIIATTEAIPPLYLTDDYGTNITDDYGAPIQGNV
jgi:hypothetical protein